MSMGIDNPFAVQPRPSAVMRAVKVLLLSVGCLSALLALHHGSRRWLLHRLTADLARQPSAVQIQRLPAIADLGAIGLPVVVRQLAAADANVAAAAYDVLRSRQTRWSQLPDAEGDALHRRLAESLAPLAEQLPRSRRGWAAALLNRTIVETVEHDSSDADAAYRIATDTLPQLSLAAAESTAVPFDDAASGHDSTVRVAQRTGPLPIDLLRGGATLHPDPQATAEAPRPLADASPSNAAPPDAAAGGAAAGDGALQRLDPAATAPLQQLQPAQDASTQSPPIQRVVVTAHQLTAAPFETYTTRSVIAWLRSVQPRLRDLAQEELKRRGLTAAEIQLAIRLADPDIRVRMALLDELGHRPDVQPRQWLLWLAEDAERDIRLRAVAALATMVDSHVQQQLAERLPAEADLAVAAQIRRVLNQR